MDGLAYRRFAAAISVAVLWNASAVAQTSGEERPPFVGGGGGFVCKDWRTIRNSAARVRSHQSDLDRDKDNFVLEYGIEQWILGFVSATTINLESGAKSARETMFCETNDRDIIRRGTYFVSKNQALIFGKRSGS